MYHSVSDAPEDRVHPYFRLNTSPRRFAQQMQVLQETGWEVVPLSAILAPEREPALNARRRVAITFDDGYEDFLSLAFPILQEHNFAASVFLPTDYVGGGAHFNGRPCLSWPQVRELHRAGVQFGSHTASHPQLYATAEASQEEELRRSKLEIEAHLGQVVDAFSYPYAFPQHDRSFRLRIRDLLERCGYAYGVSTILGRVRPSEDRYFARRLPVNGDDDARLLRAKLDGGYDWLHGVQYATKALRRAIA